MGYTLSIENETYPVEDIHFVKGSRPVKDPVGKLFSFVSPVRLTIGQHCRLLGDSVGYQLLINACLGFTYVPGFLVSGIVAAKETAVANTVM